MTDFAPRVGFAYRITDKVVVRSGYGMFYVPRNIQGNGLGAITAFRDTPMVTSLDNNITPLNRLSNPFPQGVLPTLNDRDPGANVGAQIQAPFYENKSGYVQLWSFALQWEMPGSVVMQAMYWGNKGTNLLAPGQNINQLPNEYLALGQRAERSGAESVLRRHHRGRSFRPHDFAAAVAAARIRSTPAMPACSGSSRRSAIPATMARRCRPSGARAIAHVPARVHLVEGDR